MTLSKADPPALERAFYAVVAALLDMENDYAPFMDVRRIYDDAGALVAEGVKWKSRWNNRRPGNGRYPGHGIVRYFGPTAIHVHLHTPAVRGAFTSVDEALKAIAAAVHRSLPTSPTTV